VPENRQQWDSRATGVRRARYQLNTALQQTFSSREKTAWLSPHGLGCSSGSGPWQGCLEQFPASQCVWGAGSLENESCLSWLQWVPTVEYCAAQSCCFTTVSLCIHLSSCAQCWLHCRPPKLNIPYHLNCGLEISQFLFWVTLTHCIYYMVWLENLILITLQTDGWVWWWLWKLI